MPGELQLQAQVPRSWPIRIHTLGRFQVEIRGEPLQRTGRTRRKPFELLKALVAMGGEGPISDLTESVWPDADGDRAYTSFYTNKSRLKDVFAVQIVEVQDGRAFVNRQVCWVDALVFPDLLRDVARGIESAALDVAWQHMEEALTLYRGPFLAGEFEPAEILPARDRLHAMFLRHIEALGRSLRSAGQLERAVELYRKGLEIDDTAEELYRSLLEAYRDLGRVADGVAVYHRCARAFQASVGIAPSSRIEALYRELLQIQHERADAQSAAEHTRSAQPAGGDQGPAARQPGGGQRESAPPPVVEEAERRHVTTVCHVVAGWADLFTSHDPEAVGQLLREVRNALESVAADFRGVVNHAINDEAVVLYGIPAAHEDDPQRAVQACLEAHRRIRELPSPTGGEGKGALLLQSGVESGPVLLEQGGRGEGKLGTIGNAVNQAVLLARQAGPDEILLGARALALVQPFFATEPAGPAAGSGAAPQRVLAFKGALGRMEIAERLGLTPHVGREAELRTLAEALRAARDGRGQLVSIVGEAGVGKSRLVHEFCRQADDAIGQLRADCQPHGENTPYLPFQELLRRGLNLREEDRPASMRRKIERSLRALDPTLAQHAPYCLRLLSIPGAEAALPGTMTAEELRRGIVTALVAILSVALSRRPMLVVLEDLHWADEASITALRNLSGVLAQYPVLFVVTYRSEFEIRWLRHGHHLHIDLESLASENVRAMLQSLLGTATVSAELVDWLYEHTEGNPFFIEEVCRTLRDDPALALDEGRARLVGNVARPDIPDTVQAVIRARLDRLAPESLKALRIAAVIGPTFGVGTLMHVSPTRGETVGELESLAAAQLIRQVQVVPEARYRFCHNITQRVVYDSLLVQQRKMLHQRVGEAIEVLYGERIEEHFESLAHHFAHGTDVERALKYLELAAQKAAQVFSLQDAREHYRSAHTLLQELPPTPQNVLRRIDTVIRLGMVSFYRPSQVLLQQLEAARAETERLRDDRRHTTTTFLVGTINYAMAHHETALAAFAQCLELPAVDEGMRALASNYIGRIHFYLTDFTAATKHLLPGIETLEALGNYVEAANSMTVLGCLHGTCGRIAEGRVLAERVTVLGSEAGNPALVAVGQVSLAMVAGYAGKWQEAHAAGLRARDTAHSISNTIAEGMGIWWAGLASAMLGDVEQGIVLMREGISTTESAESGLALGGMTAELARICAAEGRLEEAQAYVRKSRQLVANGADRLGELVLPFAEAVLAAKRRPGQVKSVKTIMDQVLRLCEQRGARQWLAINHYYYALLMVRLRQPGSANAQIEKALALFAELGMPWWKRKTAALRKQLHRG